LPHYLILFVEYTVYKYLNINYKLPILFSKFTQNKYYTTLHAFRLFFFAVYHPYKSP